MSAGASARTGETHRQGRRIVGAAELAAHLGLVHRPTPEQIAVIESPLAPLLVVAGAGSGKTQTMALRVCWLVINGLVAPERVLGLTFTRKAASELSERIRALLARAPRDRAPRDRAPLDSASLGAGDDESPTVSTYHAYAGRIFSEHALRVGREPGSALWGEAACWQLATSVVDAYDGPMDAVPWVPSTVSGLVLDLAGDLAEHLVSPEDLRALIRAIQARAGALPAGASRSRNPFPQETTAMLGGLAAREQLLALVERYTAAKRAADAVDYGDQVALAATLARDHPQVAQGERDRFDLVVLDEYQDTGHAQRALLRALFGRGHAVIAVGDPCQSIYGWRGASAGNLTRFPEDFADVLGPARQLTLSTSFRNGRRILEVANLISAPLRAASIPVPELEPSPEAETASVTVAMLETEAAEADWVADQIASLLLPGGSAAETSGGPGVEASAESVLLQPREVAVLVRRRSQMPALAAALEDRGVPVEVAGLGGLLSTPEVADVVAVLRIMADQNPSVALMRLLTSRRWRLGPRDLMALGRRARELAHASQCAGSSGASTMASSSGESERVAPDDENIPVDLIEALDDLGDPVDYSPAGHQRLASIRAELRVLRRRASAPVPELILEVISMLRLDIELVASGEAGRAGQAHLEALLDVADSMCHQQVDLRSSTMSLPAFCRWLDAAAQRERGLDRGAPELTPDAVSLVTAHSAKGLEWQVVAVAGLCEGIFPARSPAATSWAGRRTTLPFPLRGDAADLPVLDLGACTDQAELEAALNGLDAACKDRDLLEERRLAYVAMTRARSVLLLSGHRWGSGVRPRLASRFVVELAPLAQAGVVDVAHELPELGGDEVNPGLGEVDTRDWPADPLSGVSRHELVAAAALVRAEQSRSSDDRRDDPMTTARPSVSDDEQVAAWSDEVDRLLRERGSRSAAGEVELPAQLSVTDLISLHRDPAELALRLRRPMPSGLYGRTRTGTAFHAWLERRYQSPALFELDEIPGSADDLAADVTLESLQKAFLAGAYGQASPVEVEVPFDMVLAGVLVRGRMDAVFARPDGSWDVIDWKTGPPLAPPALQSAAVQLATYRLAWAALAGVEVSQVYAGFYHVREDRTLRPADLLDRSGLERLIRSVPVAALTGD